MIWIEGDFEDLVEKIGANMWIEDMEIVDEDT